MKAIKRLLLAAIVLLLAITLIAWRAPASLAQSWLQGSDLPLRLELTRGTLWRGAAAKAHWQGLQLGGLDWRITGLHPLDRSIDLALNADNGALRLKGEINANSRSQVTSKGIQGRMPAQWIDIQLIAPFTFLNGELLWNLDQLALQPDTLPRLDGEILWRDASLTGLTRANLGTIQFDFDNNPGILKATIYSLDKADVMLNGTIDSDGVNYHVDLTLEVDSDRPDIFEQLAGFGRVRIDGRIMFDFEGRLFPE